ncbi:unnamed protein product [Pleuronectes platessa]|uniref:Uncharacterized protein n=1 Tax=Pleuronectes platessa TaxID=8262 RepID=A0A9N7Z100_PLEPL|nr:unnamed protein product [Pleuronectes platessa]
MEDGRLHHHLTPVNYPTIKAKENWRWHGCEGVEVRGVSGRGVGGAAGGRGWGVGGSDKHGYQSISPPVNDSAVKVKVEGILWSVSATETEKSVKTRETLETSSEFRASLIEASPVGVRVNEEHREACLPDV